MALPVAAIVCIVLACWAVVVLAIFGLYHLLKRRGVCSCECKPCGTEGGESCTCCKSASEACNCCNPSLNGCLDSVCPKKKCSCVDIILCQCCSEPGQDSCLVNVPVFKCDCPCAPFLVKDNNGKLVFMYQSVCEWAHSKISKCTTGISDCMKCNSQSSIDCLTCAKYKVTCLSAFKTGKCCDVDTAGSTGTWPLYEIRVSRRLRGINQCSSCPEHFLCFEFNVTETVNCCCHYFCCNRCGDPLFVYRGENDICYYQDSNCLVFLIQNVFRSVSCLYLSCFGILGNSIKCCISSCALCARISCCRCGNDMFCTDFSCCCFDFRKVKRNLGCGHVDVASGQNVESMDGKCICCVYRSGIDLSTLNYEIKIETPLQLLQQDCGDIQLVQPKRVSIPKLQKSEVIENYSISSVYNLQKSELQACELIDERTHSKTVGRRYSQKTANKNSRSDPGFSQPSNNKHVSTSLHINNDGRDEHSSQNHSVQQDISSSSESDYDHNAIYKRRKQSHPGDRAKSGRNQKLSSDLQQSQKLTAPARYGNNPDSDGSDDIAVNRSERENQSFIDRKHMHQLQEKLLQQPTDSDLTTNMADFKKGKKNKKPKKQSFPIENRESAKNSDDEQKSIIGILKTPSKISEKRLFSASVTDKPRKITRFSDEELIRESFPVRSDRNVKQVVSFKKGKVQDSSERYVKSDSGSSVTNYSSSDSDTERSVKKGGQTSLRAAERSESLEKGGQTSQKAAGTSASQEMVGQTSQGAARKSASLVMRGKTSQSADERRASMKKRRQTSQWAAERSPSVEMGEQTTRWAASKSEEDSMRKTPTTERENKRYKLETSAGKSYRLKDADNSTDDDDSYTGPSKDRIKMEKSDQFREQNKNSSVKIGWELKEDSVEMRNKKTDQKVERCSQKLTGDGLEDRDSEIMRSPDCRPIAQRMKELRKKWLQEDSD